MAASQMAFSARTKSSEVTVGAQYFSMCSITNCVPFRG